MAVVGPTMVRRTILFPSRAFTSKPPYNPIRSTGDDKNRKASPNKGPRSNMRGHDRGALGCRKKSWQRDHP
jgi:hypothetical protein